MLVYPRYLVNISFSGLEIVDKHFNIEDIIFTVSTYNPQFTHMEVKHNNLDKLCLKKLVVKLV